ncbi:iron complex transport system permease protein [Clostridium saccharoperbutylacetonicum]|uniref:ABC-type enterobactin transport system, permease component n=1 Tax=Clostridium saccharoperbutylacetonicum N1-4(HMT) TaxID=931276 RepID=M1LZ18_9CLOT|nr:iron chelate uptake ABC transporter family permease subunit [Clostridium saccharoperbutylacetonicum]AGF58545.1 ABC-type enterobactin transport system, permease component [Clostridium saccharoperbutylacetonicum N1-4(HMT)]NRT60677.1 iron complex transport system permease protein [Clostridium saccharoperbutylacetonicum]NSB23991.1 iron complex transport system permease protein [Clostridium saccharoperbutylacetonicum]NSB43367.1 iron complex transport system permease protein [Clostridium saccharop
MIQTTHSMLKDGYTKRKIRRLSVNILLLVLTVGLCLIMLLYGKTNYSLTTVTRVLLGEQIQGATFTIETLRLPRMLCGLLVGIAFGIAGNTFQTMLRNPLASPDIIGISSGASVAAVFSILVLHMSGSIVSIAAVISGISLSILIYLLSKSSGFSSSRLILIGIGIQAMANALISFLLIKASEYEVSNALTWLSGSLNGISIKEIPTLFVVVAIFGFIILCLTNQLQILELGDEFAITLGIKINLIRISLILSSVFLIAFATAVTGPIAFVAFLAGPISARLVGFGASNVFASGLVGAILVLGADMIGQYVFSTRFPVGIITGILGAPYMLLLLITMNRRGRA